MTPGQTVTWNPFNKRLARSGYPQAYGQRLTVTRVRPLSDLCTCGAGDADPDSHHSTCHVQNPELRLKFPMVQVLTSQGEKEFSHLCFVPV